MHRTYDWTAPAKVFHWPADDGAEEEAMYPTLKAAITAAGEGDRETAWIITHEGHILNPRMIFEMSLDMKAPRPARRINPLALLGLGRAR